MNIRNYKLIKNISDCCNLQQLQLVILEDYLETTTCGKSYDRGKRTQNVFHIFTKLVEGVHKKLLVRDDHTC